MATAEGNPAPEETPYDRARHAIAEMTTPSGMILGDVIARVVLDSGWVTPSSPAATTGEADECSGEGDTCLTHGGCWEFNDEGLAVVCDQADMYPAPVSSGEGGDDAAPGA